MYIVFVLDMSVSFVMHVHVLIQRTPSEVIIQVYLSFYIASIMEAFLKNCGFFSFVCISHTVMIGKL